MGYHVGDIGAEFIVEFQRNGAAYDISSYTTKQIIVKSPDGTLKTWTASFVTDGTDGQIIFTTTAAGDLHESASWQIQGRAAKTGEDFRTDIGTFVVEEILS